MSAALKQPEVWHLTVTRYCGKQIVSEIQQTILFTKKTGKLVINYSQGTAVSAEFEEKTKNALTCDMK